MEVIEIKNLGKGLRSQFEEIYKEAFPLNEQQPLELIYERINENNEIFIGAFNGEELVAFALLFFLRSTDYFLLDYLAVKNGKRNDGLGGMLLQKVLELTFEKKKNILLEVDHPNLPENKSKNISRIHFYQKYGAKIIDNLIYKLPDLEGKNNPTDQYLMVISYQKNIEYLSKIEVENLLIQLYSQLYGSIYDQETLKKMNNGLKEINLLFKI